MVVSTMGANDEPIVIVRHGVAPGRAIPGAAEPLPLFSSGIG